MFASTLPLHNEAIADGRVLQLPCDECDGAGEVTRSADPERDSFNGPVDVECGTCGGEGYETVPVTIMTTPWLQMAITGGAYSQEERGIMADEVTRRMDAAA